MGEARIAANEQLAQAQGTLARAKAAVKATGLPTSSDEEEEEPPEGRVPCPCAPCDESFDRGDLGGLALHIQTRHSRQRESLGEAYQSLGSIRKQPSIPRPSINRDCTPAAWSTFMFEWEDYATEYDLPPASRNAQLMQCLSSELKQKVHARVASYRTKPINDLIAEVKSLTVRPVAIGKRRRTAHTATQGEGELFGSFAARVKALVVDCDYVLDCPHAARAPPM